MQAPTQVQAHPHPPSRTRPSDPGLPAFRDEYPRLRPYPAPEPGPRGTFPTQPAPRGFGDPPPSPPPPPQRPASPWLEYLDDLVGNGGPEPGDYPRLLACFAHLTRGGPRDPTRQALTAAAREILAPILIRATLLGTLHLRARGYPGDFEVVERILSYHHSPDPNLVRWDAWCHTLPLARALRHRAAHLREHLHRLEADSGPTPSRILHLRGGPGRELADYFIAHGPASRLRADCVDPDPLAAPHGRRNVIRLTDRVTFHTAPVLRFHTAHRYRLIWGSGLGEGLSDRGVVLVLRRLLRLLEPGGTLVFCQFDRTDEAGPVLDVITGWRPACRTAAHLQALALQAGVPPHSIRVVQDPPYPNLYLQLAPGAATQRTFCRGMPRRSSQ